MSHRCSSTPATRETTHGRHAEWRPRDRNERLFYVSLGYRLVALNPKTGRPVPDFGQDGVVDLWEGLDQDKTPQEGDFSLTSPPAVIGDVVVVGAAMRQSAIAGFPRGFDVRNGQRLWTFHTIPQQDEFGNDSWEGDSWRYTGNTGVWAPISVDEDLGYVYLGVETPTNDWYGGHRLGDNLFANSLVCVDAKTGERVWHFQLTHHDIWDYDIPAAANLVDITVDGKKIKAVAQVSKQAFTYVFDRITGEPVWPIAETPVPASGIPGERASPTQPFPTKPPPFDRQGITFEDLIALTPELQAQALEMVQGVPTRVALHPDAAHRGGGDAGHTDAAVGQWRCQLAGRGGRSGNGYPLYPVDHECLAARASAQRKTQRPQAIRHRRCRLQQPCHPTPGSTARETTVEPDYRHRSQHRRAFMDDPERRRAHLYPEPSGFAWGGPLQHRDGRQFRAARDQDATLCRPGCGSPRRAPRRWRQDVPRD